MFAGTRILSLYLAQSICAAAQKDGQAYCDHAKAPARKSCEDIRNRGVKDGNWNNNDEWWSGNCRVAISTGLTGNSPTLEAKVVRAAIDDILKV